MIRERRKKQYVYFEALFRAYYSRLYFYELNLLNDQASAEDIVEDVFSYLWEHYEEIVGDNSPLPLLYSLVKSRCIDFLRHRDVKERFKETISSQPDIYNDLEEGTEHHERIEKIMKAIEVLPPQTRKVFEACFLYGKKYKEVGNEMHISINTVKTHITRALSFIRKQTEESSGLD